jgi:hypothetical protein
MSCPQTKYLVTPEPQNIRVIADNSRELEVSISSRTRDPQRFRILQDESILTDAKGRVYRLEFKPNDYSNSHEGRSMTYVTSAFGPLPASSRHSFHSSPYRITVAYTEDGQHEVAETTFGLHYKWVTIFDLLFLSGEF